MRRYSHPGGDTTTPEVSVLTPQASPDRRVRRALVLAALSWLVLPVVLAVGALVLAAQAERDLFESDPLGGSRPGGLGLVRVLAWANIALFGLALVFLAGLALGYLSAAPP